MEHALPQLIKEEVIERSALPHSGYSGAELERVRLRDGSRLVLKHITPEGDWALRITRDRGREAALWTTGVLNRVADVIDYPVVSVELGADGWTIVMRDVSDVLRRDDRYSRADSAGSSRRSRGSTTRSGANVSTVSARSRIGSDSSRRRWVGRGTAEGVSKGWEMFAENAPTDIWEATWRMMDRPEELVAELERGEMTVIHGDLRTVNLGFDAERLVLLDWGLAAHAPREVDLVWWLMQGGEPDAAFDELLDDIHDIVAAEFDERSLALAFLGQMTLTGYWYGRAVEFSDEERGHAEAQRDWHFARARACMDSYWSPR
jgi:aminoglycoside phosphotransferase (APT) family kinase protein